MGALLGFFGAATMAPTMLLRLKALVIVAMALLAAFLLVATWALLERSGRLSLKVEVVTLRAQTAVLADSLKRCNDGVARLGEAGQGAIAETKRLLGMAERALERNAAVRDEIKGIVRAPTPVRPDGKAKDCGDALAEIKAKVKQ